MAPPRAATQLVPVIHIPPLNPSTPAEPAPSAPATIDFTKQFSQSQLALALVIQKSKPDGVSTAEYCQQLRKRIKAGRGVINCEDHRYIDTAEFWKDQYMRIHLEKKALEDRIYHSEEESRLLGEGDQDLGPLDCQVRHILGRSNNDDHPEGHASLRKRSSSSDDSDDTVSESEETLPSLEDNHLRLSRYIFRIAQHRSTLQKAINNQEHADQIDELSKQCNHILSLLSTAISDCSTPLVLSTTADNDTQCLKLLQLLLNQVTISLCSCIQALNVLCRTILGRTKKVETVHRMILFFQKALDLLQSSSKLQAEHEASQRNWHKRHKQNGTPGIEYIVNKYLADSLATTVHTVEWDVSQPGHSNILEGILFLILSHTGRILSNAVFHEHVAQIPNPGNISSANNQRTPASVKLESRYILQILHAAVGRADRRDLISLILSANRQGQPSGENAPGPSVISEQHKNLLHKAKFLMQSTLVGSMLGGMDLEILKLPSPPEEMFECTVESSAAVERYGPDWFVESVWALIGWEMVV